MADAKDSKSFDRKVVWVQVPPGVQVLFLMVITDFTVIFGYEFIELLRKVLCAGELPGPCSRYK